MAVSSSTLLLLSSLVIVAGCASQKCDDHPRKADPRPVTLSIGKIRKPPVAETKNGGFRYVQLPTSAKLIRRDPGDPNISGDVRDAWEVAYGADQSGQEVVAVITLVDTFGLTRAPGDKQAAPGNALMKDFASVAGSPEQEVMGKTQQGNNLITTAGIADTGEVFQMAAAGRDPASGSPGSKSSGGTFPVTIHTNTAENYGIDHVYVWLKGKTP